MISMGQGADGDVCGSDPVCSKIQCLHRSTEEK